MRPLVGSISRLIMRSSVVLPQPDGPTSTATSPSGTSSVSSRTATVPFGYCLLTLQRIIGGLRRSHARSNASEHGLDRSSSPRRCSRRMILRLRRSQLRERRMIDVLAAYDGHTWIDWSWVSDHGCRHSRAPARARDAAAVGAAARVSLIAFPLALLVGGAPPRARRSCSRPRACCTRSRRSPRSRCCCRTPGCRV